MLGLPTELYNRLRAIFLKCSEFGSNVSLRAMFVTDELYPFRSGLPESASTGERVDACLDYLLSKHLSNGQSALPSFLAALRDRYQSGDALRDELQALLDTVTSATDSGLPSKSKWNTAVVRELLTAAFSDEELTTLCFDNFRPVYDNDLATGMGKGEKIQRLVEYCDRHDQIGNLLVMVRENNAAQYARFEIRLKGK